ncbi:MAG: cytochrome c-type biogenesis protein CcmH [Gemmatimonadota bacterium]
MNRNVAGVSTLLPLFWILTLSAGSGGTMPLAGQTPPRSGEAFSVHPEARKAIDRIRSPYCPGMMLEVCTSAGGAMLRDSIERMAEAGLSADSIVEVIISEYGEEWRAEPKPAGTGLFVWILPPLVLLAGVGMVAVILARRKRRQEARVAGAELPREEEARLRQAMKELDEEDQPVF